MPEVLTILLIVAPTGTAGASEAPDWDEIEGVVAATGGRVFERTVELAGASRSSAWAAFHIAADAASAALRLAHAPAGDADAAHPQLRIALCTGEVDRAGDGYRGSAVDRVRALATLPVEARILLAGPTAVMVSLALPPGAELIDLGTQPVSEHRHERVHELRPPGAARKDLPGDTAASNLGWARRAAAGLVVGREAPAAQLHAAWERAVAGEHRMAVVSGDPGIGKTTVAAELALRVHADGALVLYGRWDEEALAPYQAIREALGTYAAACPKALLRADLAGRADELARLLPDIGARVGGVRAALADDPDAERRRLFDAVTEWLDALAARRPVLLVLDDLQWAERSSLLLLRHLFDSPPASPMLAVLTLRDGEVEGMGPLHTLGTFEAGDDVERLELSGLPSDAVQRLVEQSLGHPVGRQEAEITAWLADETAGNPLFVQEVLRGLDASDPGASLRAVRHHLPDRLHDVVRWRLAKLDPEVGDALVVASFIGEEFGLEVLSATVDRSMIDLRHQFDDAVHAGVVREVLDDRMAFAHAIVRRTLQEELPAAAAAGLHRRIADVLVDRAGEGASAPEIAHHYLSAATAPGTPGDETAGVDGDTVARAVRWGRAAVARAVRWGRAAADQARRETAFEGAVWFLSRVVDVQDRHADRGVDQALACDLRLELAEAHDRAGDFTARDRRHLEAADLARRLDRTDLFTRAALGYGGRLPAASMPNPTAHALLVEGLERLPPTDSRARALMLARLAHALHLAAPHAERRALSDEAVAMARRLDAPVVLASVLVSRSLALDGPDDVDEQLDIGAEVIAIGRQTGDPDLVVQGARARVHALFVLGRHAEAHGLAGELSTLADQLRHPDHLRIASMWTTMWAGLEGRFDEALSRADALRQELGVAGHSQALMMNFAQTFVLRLLHGGVDAVRPVADATRHVDAFALNGSLMLAWLESGAGDLDRARELLAKVDPDDLAAYDHGYLWLPTVVAAAGAAAATGDAGWAEAAHAALSPYRGRNCVMGYASFLGAADHHLGTLDAVLGRSDAAADELESALERHRSLGARPFMAVSARWLANTLAERNRGDDRDRALLLHAEST
ncbi:MAG TPA: AAA family ATPase, partial [Acidimicrobiales bacterium]|nr:AAA family ATPase [Acidimicrobiales bacterium]